MLLKSTNTLDWVVTANCLQFASYMFQPIMGQCQGVPVTRIRYRDTITLRVIEAVTH